MASSKNVVQSRCIDECGFGLVWSQSTSNFTCDQVINYCTRYVKWYYLCDGLKLTIDYTHILFGIVGLFGFIIMHFMYRRKSFGAVSFIYHRAMVYMEIVHMIVMIQSGIFMSRGYQDNYYYLLYRTIWCELWVFGDAMKLNVAVLTTILSFERAAAIWSDRTFKRINRKPIARSLVAVALIPGILHFSPLLSGYSEQESPNSTIYILVENPLGQRINLACWDVIYALKIIVSFLIAVLCVAIVAGLIIKSRKSQQLSSNGQEKWRQSKMLCAMQLVLAFCCLFDHTVWVVNKMIKYDTVYYTGLDAIPRLTYAEALWTLDRRLSFHITWVMESVCGELDHGLRFFIYLICLKSFRDAFLSLINRSKVSTVFMSTHSKSVT